ncbi:MAG: hypothetical protein P4L81_05325 [Candidatus Pacebacteria bacterium]|nr:hypothetical protein [Candidatus Paceibacterota bacterium]
MSRFQQIVWAIIVVLVIIGAYWWWSSSQATTSGAAVAPFTQTPTTSTQAQSGVASQAQKSATVTFDGSGFSPSSVTIAQGGTVTFVSNAGAMWVASDPHPIHNGYDGTTMQQHCSSTYAGTAPFDQCAAGTSFSFTFNKVGSWGYHNHLDHSAVGTITVVAQ